MEKFDSEKAKRVWQRVQSGPQPEAINDMQPLILRALSDAAVLSLLLRKLQGKNQMVLRQIYDRKTANAAILKGIYVMSTGLKPNVSAYPAEDAPAQVLLRRCYGRQMQTLAEYENRKADPQFGKVFQRLEEQELQSCCTLLEILGK